MSSTAISVEFGGGAELLFDKVKKHDVKLPAKETPCKDCKRTPAMDERQHAEGASRTLLQGDTVRPGILVLINDADWELMGELDYTIQENDKIVFISTLHGG